MVDAPCLWTALALVHQFLFTEQTTMTNGNFNRCTEFPIVPPELDRPHLYEFENASHAIGEIPEWERDENVRLVWRGADNAPTEHDSPARLEQVNELPDQEY